MADTSSDTGMGPDVPTTTARSTRRTRRMAIIGALALVIVAGAVLVGVKTTGARSGAISTAAINKSSVHDSCYNTSGFDTTTNLDFTGLTLRPWNAIPPYSYTIYINGVAAATGKVEYTSVIDIQFHDIDWGLYRVTIPSLRIGWDKSPSTGLDMSYANMTCRS